MESFSQRMGIDPIRTLIQRESADERLRNHLWNSLSIFYFSRFKGYYDDLEENVRTLITRIWVRYYGLRIDELDDFTPDLVRRLKRDFLDSSWNKMFDLLEFIPNNYYENEYSKGFDSHYNRNFIEFANDILKEQISAYRFVNGIITEITSTEEISTITDTLNNPSIKTPVQTHLKRALELFSDRTNPDYRNSIKESISAVESYCCIITDNPKAKLDDALKIIEEKYGLHRALKKSFSILYGYASDENGIRHKLHEESNLKQEDAKFMLVACSAFINYLVVKINI